MSDYIKITNELVKERGKSQDHIAALESEIDDLRGENDELKAENAKLKPALVPLLNKISKLKTENTKLQAEQAEYIGALKSLLEFPNDHRIVKIGRMVAGKHSMGLAYLNEMTERRESNKKLQAENAILRSERDEAVSLFREFYTAQLKCHIILEGDFDIHGWGDRATALFEKLRNKDND